MPSYTITFQPEGISVQVPSGTSLLQAEVLAGLQPDAPCAGLGTCGKCRAFIEGIQILACQTLADRDMTIYLPSGHDDYEQAVKEASEDSDAGRIKSCVLAFDVGTTTVAGYILDGETGKQLAYASVLNPQCQFGADVISRIQKALEGDMVLLQQCIAAALKRLTRDLAEEAKVSPECISAVAIAGNTAMHHLLLGIDPKPLITPPYMPAVIEAMELYRGCAIRILPNIAGFIGGDMVGCMVATQFDQEEDLALLIDIGTNGEMLLGNRHRRIACSTAAGPAFEGAKISCGMRSVEGAVTRVTVESGKPKFHVIGGGMPVGICGSGLVDLAAFLLDEGIIDDTGFMACGQYCLEDSNVILTQKDIRELQLAKAAIRAGIDLLAETMEISTADIKKVYLAGAFGAYMDPKSACRIGMIPPVLSDRISVIGNGAGEGAKQCALHYEVFLRSQELARETDFLELAAIPRFQEKYIDALGFEEEGI